MAVYVDFNLVRAGMVDDPADYRWMQCVKAIAGKARGRRTLVRILGQIAWPLETGVGAQLFGGAPFPAVGERRVLVFYWEILGGQGTARTREDGTVIRRGVSEKSRRT
jgi:hypothetical protein